jgi:alpha-ribazole phosphatase/probable phosphoglycerate mutase
MTRIYLLRHGETAWNAQDNRYCGRTDLPLSAAGQVQGAAAARALARVALAAVYVSPLRRSRETGELVAAAGSRPIVEDVRLLEIDFGAWEGLTAAEIAVADPAGRAAWLADPTTTRAGGTGETGHEVSVRMTDFFRDLARSSPNATIAVIGHNTANRLFLAASLGAPLASYRRLTLGNASISTLELTDSGVHWLHINDVSHLGT